MKLFIGNRYIGFTFAVLYHIPTNENIKKGTPENVPCEEQLATEENLHDRIAALHLLYFDQKT